MQYNEEWFEVAWSDQRRIPRVSKFLRRDFGVAADIVEARWPLWTATEKGEFAAAFSQRPRLNENDTQVLDFLMENGGPPIWRTIALIVVRHPDRTRALNFLLARVAEGMKPAANFYQALGMLLAPECVPILHVALLKHRKEIEANPLIKAWSDRFLYLDYLSCSATLFLVTRQRVYRDNLRRMVRHRDQTVRRLARMVTATSGVAAG